jgi:DNA-binding HxlR family transcriptional regulator
MKQEGTVMSLDNKPVTTIDNVACKCEIEKTYSTETCAPIRETLSRVGDKWSVLIVSLLSGGPLRFSELKRKIAAISQRMLTRTLRELERDGLLTRTVEPTVPPRVTYELTELGQTLLEPVKALANWARLNYDEIKKSQKKYDDMNASI